MIVFLVYQTPGSEGMQLPANRRSNPAPDAAQICLPVKENPQFDRPGTTLGVSAFVSVIYIDTGTVYAIFLDGHSL